MEIIIGISVLVYLISCYGWWKHTQIAYGKGGRWEGDVTVDNAVIMFCPVINTAFCLVGFILYLPRKRIKTEKKDYNKFFNIKK